MQKVLTAEEMREVDRLTTEKYGIPSIILMENAAHAVARTITEKLGGSVKDKSVLILCGKGNNGGDGAALARILAIQGALCSVLLIGSINETKGDSYVNYSILKKIRSSFENHFSHGYESRCGLNENSEGSLDLFLTNSRLENNDVFIDALFGTGLNKPLAEQLNDLIKFFKNWNNFEIERANNLNVKKEKLFVSVDLPSGLNADLSYPIGENFQADLTVTFTAPKLANVFPPASNFNGELVVANIGSPQELIDNSPSKLFVTEKTDAQSWLMETKVKPNSYKKTRGTALIIAGSENYSGAAVLAANACFASGCGMVTVAVPSEIHQIVASKTLDEVIVKPLGNIAFNAKVTAIGCGFSSDKKTHKFIRETVLDRKTSMILDAEALNALSPFDLKGSDEFPLVLTPHVGEFSRLLGREVGEDKIAEVREFAQKHNVILVLKGGRSLIAHPNGTVVINPTGNAGVSRAGAGDTLTGIITSFLAQTSAVKDLNLDSAFETVVAALYIAGVAGEIAAEKFTQRLMTATDIRNCLQEAIERVKN